MNSKKKINILEYLKRKNVKRYSVFFAIAFVILIFSKLSNDYKQTIKLKVNFVNLQDEIILQNDSLNTINAYIKAKGFSLVPFMFKSSKNIFVDIETDVVSKPNQYIFDILKHQYLIEEQLGSSFKVLTLKPDTLIIPYSKRAAKMVPLILQSSINYDDGYDILGEFILSVDSVKVVGSAQELVSINSLSTKILTLEDVNTNINETLELDVLDYKTLDIFPKTIGVTGNVTKFTEGTIQIPVSIINKPNNIKLNYFPKSVTLSYYVDLDNYSAIKQTDFAVECNYDNVKENQSYFVPKLIKSPEFIKRVNIKQKRIDFIKL